jgi:hypothetical protein
MPAISFGDGNPMKAIRQNGYTDTWQQIGRRISRPSAILSISTHWFVPGTAFADRAITIAEHGAAAIMPRKKEIDVLNQPWLPEVIRARRQTFHRIKPTSFNPFRTN